MMFGRKASRIVRHRPPAARRGRFLLRSKAHKPVQKSKRRRRYRFGRVSQKLTILNRMRHVLQPAARFVTIPAYKTYNASLAFAATKAKIAGNLSMAVARTLAPQTLAEALSGLKGKWSHLSAATPTVVLNRLSMLGHDVRSAVVLYLRPVSHAFNQAAGWTGQISGRVSGLFTRLTNSHGLRRLHPAQTMEAPAPELERKRAPAPAVA